MKIKTLAALAVTTVALTACSLYAPVSHVTINEIEAGSVVTIGGADLHVVMIPEGDFNARCIGNLGGALQQDWRGFVCVVTT